MLFRSRAVLLGLSLACVACAGHDAAHASAGTSARAASAGSGGTAASPRAADSGSTEADGGEAIDASMAGQGGAPHTVAGAGASGNAAAAGSSSNAAVSCASARPDASNTGVPAGVMLTTVDHDVKVTSDNSVLDAQDIHGFLIISASHVKVTRSLVRGGTATSNGAGIRVTSGSDILIEDTEVALATPSALLDGVTGANFIVRRANIHGGVDGMKLGDNSRVECSFIHDMTSFASDPNQAGGATHNDAIQILSGSGLTIIGNTLVASKDQNSAIQITQDFGAVGDVHIDANWADGGGCTFNFAHKGGSSLAVAASGNRFGRDSFYDCPILKSTKTTLDANGNVWDDTSMPVPVQTHD
jgi:hypothetical protein